MNKSSFIFGILSIGIILANLDLIDASTPQSNSSTNSGHVKKLSSTSRRPSKPSPPKRTQPKIEFETQSHSDIHVPSLSCILFKDLGCAAQCTVVGNLIGYDEDISAVCDEARACICTSSKKSQPDKLIADQQNLHLKDLRKYVYREVKGVLQRSPLAVSTNLDYLNWVTNFFEYLDANKQNNATIQSVYHQVRITNNALLEEYLDIFLRQDGVQAEDTTQGSKQDNKIPQNVTSRVISRLINEIGIPKKFPTNVTPSQGRNS